jgi:hypothetical protein
MDSEDDMHDANDSAEDDDFYSGGEAGLAASDDGDADYDFADHDSDDSAELLSHRQQVSSVPTSPPRMRCVLAWRSDVGCAFILFLMRGCKSRRSKRLLLLCCSYRLIALVGCGSVEWPCPCIGLPSFINVVVHARAFREYLCIYLV